MYENIQNRSLIILSEKIQNTNDFPCVFVGLVSSCSFNKKYLREASFISYCKYNSKPIESGLPVLRCILSPLIPVTKISGLFKTSKRNKEVNNIVLNVQT